MDILKFIYKYKGVGVAYCMQSKYTHITQDLKKTVTRQDVSQITVSSVKLVQTGHRSVTELWVPAVLFAGGAKPTEHSCNSFLLRVDNVAKVSATSFTNLCN